MHLHELKIANLRCVASSSMQPSPGINLIVGDNGAGKTSLLEAVYLLGRRSSFRPSLSRSLIRDGAEELTVFAKLAGSGPRTLAVSRSRDSSYARIDGLASQGMVPLLRSFPVTVLEPGQHRLLEDGPSLRRQFLDWAVFHVKPEFLELWRRYARSLRQRNQALRNGNRSAAQTWTEPLADAGIRVHAMRAEVAQALAREVSGIFGQLVADGNPSIRYRAGWLAGADYRDVLDRGLEGDLARGHTQSGPHRAELAVSIDRRPARELLSRGQQKLLLAALIFGQVRLLRASGVEAVVLVDDFGSELGPGLRQGLWDQLEKLGAQAFVTVLEKAQLPASAHPGGMFHVKHGVLTPMV